MNEMRATVRFAGRLLAVLALGLAAQAGVVLAQETNITPPAALALDNIPPISKRLATEVQQYTEFKPTSFSDWHPQRREMLISRRHQNTTQIYRLSAPGAVPELLTDYPEPVRHASYQPTRGDYTLFTRDSGGSEVFRLYRAAPAGKPGLDHVQAISPADRRVQDLAWSTRGDRVVYTTVPVNRSGSNDKVRTDLHVVDPQADPGAEGKGRVIASLDGGGWFGFTWSPDDRHLAMLEYISINESHLWIMEVASGAKRRLLKPAEGDPVSYGKVRFSRDGKGLYTLTDRGAEFKRLTYIDLATLKHTTLTADIPWDVQDFDLSHDGKLLAYVSNEDGTGVLHLLRTKDRRALPAPKLPLGTLSDVRWHRGSANLAFTVSSARSPADVYAYNIKTRRLTRWTQHDAVGADPAGFVEPELVRWKSFDGRSISGFIYRAPASRFPGRRPVLVNIHGGPESQYRPGFAGRNNYFVNEMGISMIWPNVRGSSGYGKSFLKLDNGRLREDSVKDIGALFDWIAGQPDLDASRVLVQGGSYGGYMSLAVATLYPERIAASIDIVGISNFVTFLERTESYRRDLRRVEYGDERDPEMRKFLEAISPLNRAAQISKPLLVVQGKNDPRVPLNEAEQLVATLKQRATPVWTMVAADEGHGFAKKANADYQFYTTVAFTRRYLLGQSD